MSSYHGFPKLSLAVSGQQDGEETDNEGLGGFYAPGQGWELVRRTKGQEIGKRHALVRK